MGIPLFFPHLWGIYSANTNCTLQSMHNTLIFFVALKLLPQQGHIYFRVLLGFLIFFGASAPFPLFDPPTGAILPKDFLKIKISSKSCEIQKSSVSSVGSVNVHP